ncbi:hypothetical protein [Sediminibacterium ginsengisoli]|uniref:Uncharacterized protein n=1 Tax=Sediminibacterium ginsengisoli TaxID=413434 RepID=A0A1T4PIC9_9BACT|nr:hypothetical protein [Sediminibacterium ginsengisoli]SJZ91077.1 hypothetical protein SAMN04488132_10623 [Sediminibacterium ginsengisoli]
MKLISFVCFLSVCLGCTNMNGGEIKGACASLKTVCSKYVSMPVEKNILKTAVAASGEATGTTPFQVSILEWNEDMRIW